METQKAEVKTIAVTSLEEFNKLPKDIQKLINGLNKDLKTDSLSVFNPIVETMIKVWEFKKIKYKKGDDIAIKQFKEAKSTIRSFRAATGKAKSKLKRPYIDINKQIDDIEKVFKKNATEVLEDLEERFKPYLDEEQAKKDAKEKKKNADKLNKIAELTDETTQQQVILQRNNTYNDFTRKINNLLADANEMVSKYSKMFLQQERARIAPLTIEFDERELTILLPEQVEELKSSFELTKNTALSLIDNKIKYYDDEEEKEKELNNIEVHQEQEVQPEPEKTKNSGSFVAPSLSQKNPNFFADSITEIITEAVSKISNLNPANTIEATAQTKAVAGMKLYAEKIVQFLNQ